MGKLKESLQRLQASVLAEEARPTKAANRVSKKSKNEEDEAMDALEAVLDEIAELEEKPVLSKKENRRLVKLHQMADVADVEDDQEEDDEDEQDGEDRPKFDTSRLVESDSESEEEEEAEEEEEEEEEQEEEEQVEEEEGEEEEEEEEEEIEEEEKAEEEEVPLSDVELDDDADVVPHQRTTVNNKTALKQALASIALPRNKLPFFETLTFTSDAPISLKDIYDDLERELAFYRQGLAAASFARTALKKEKIPFTRPIDYFAEMVKTDEHMDKLKAKLVEDETAKKASQEARRQRELKKFGKKVQHAKLQDRQKEKRDTLEKIKSLKRKRAGNEITSEDFDIAIEDEVEGKGRSRDNKGPNDKRMSKNQKYGFGGRKRFKKSNDAASSADISGFTNKKNSNAGGSKKPRRLGKSKRTTRR
jgi:rRNA-processing protein EBP2